MSLFQVVWSFLKVITLISPTSPPNCPMKTLKQDLDWARVPRIVGLMPHAP